MKKLATLATLGLLVLLAAALVLSGCGTPQPAPTPTPTPTPTAKPSATPAPSPTASPTATPTATPSGGINIPADAPVVTIKFADEYPRGHTFGDPAVGNYIKILEQLGQGKIKVDYQDAGKVVKFTQMIPAAKQGLADMFNTVSSYDSAFIPLLEVWNMPFLSDDIGARTKWCWNLSTQQPDFIAAFAQFNFKPVYVWPTDDTHLSTTKVPLKKLEDIKGLKMRTSGGIVDEVLVALGANPQPIPSGETYLALQNGVVDGVVMHLTSVDGWKWYEQLKYIASMTPAFESCPGVVGINTDSWAKLPKWAQDAVMLAGQKQMEWEIPVLKDMTQKMYTKFTAAGVTVIKVDPAEVQRFKAVTPGVINKWVAKYGEQGARVWEFTKKELNIK